MEEKLFDTVEAASYLGISRESVNYFVHTRKLPSQKFGRARLIREADLITFKAIERKPGRPPKLKDRGDDPLAPETPPIVAAELKVGDVVEAPSEVKPKAKRPAKKATPTQAAKTKPTGKAETKKGK